MSAHNLKAILERHLPERGSQDDVLLRIIWLLLVTLAVLGISELIEAVLPAEVRENRYVSDLKQCRERDLPLHPQGENGRPMCDRTILFVLPELRQMPTVQP